MGMHDDAGGALPRQHGEGGDRDGHGGSAMEEAAAAGIHTIGSLMLKFKTF